MGAFTTEGKNRLLAGLPNTVYARAHDGDPTSSGTVGALAGVPLIAIPLATAVNGVRQPQTPPAGQSYQFDIGAGQRISHVSYWDGNDISNPGVTAKCLATDDVPQAETYAGGGKYTLTVQDFAA